MNVRSPLHPQWPGDHALKTWLKSFGWEKAEISFLAGDASFRTYYRLTMGQETRVLMVAPPEFEKPTEYICMTKILAKRGLSVPHIHHADEKKGFILLEDFGNALYSTCLSNGMNEKKLYENAVDVLIHLHQSPTLQPLEVYGEEKFIEEALIFLEWAYPNNCTDTLRDSYIKAWRNIYSLLPPLPQNIVLRDYMVDNILFLKERTGVQNCGLLDFQDALWGDITYDLVSLLEDARRDVSSDLAQKMVSRYLEAFPSISKDPFLHSYYVWGAQRSTKIIGVFNRLNKRDSKPHYLQHIPRVWRILREDMEHPALQPVKVWFDDHHAWGDNE